VLGGFAAGLGEGSERVDESAALLGGHRRDDAREFGAPVLVDAPDGLPGG